MREGDDRLVGEILRTADAGAASRGDEDQLFREDGHGREASLVEGFGDEGGVDPVILESPQQRRGRSGLQLHVRSGMRGVVPREDGRQAHAGRTLQRAQAQRARDYPAAEVLLGFVGQPQQALGVPEQAMTRIGEHHVPSLPPKELRTQSGLELLDAGRDVGRHPIEPVRRTQHTAFHRHTSEDVQVFQADPSHIENVIS